MLVYPNPFTESAKLIIENEEWQGKEKTVMVYNLQGKVVMQKHWPSNMNCITIHKGKLSSGMYLFMVFSGKNNIIGEGKLIIK